MLKKLVNEVIFTLRITTTGPLLIKSGYATVSGPDMAPVLTYRNGKQEVFLPGSSLKGVFRSHSERIVCSIKPRVVCYPFSGSESNEADAEQRRQDYRNPCGDTFNHKSEEERKYLEGHLDVVYSQSCPTCRLFGSTWFIGRIAIGDAYLVGPEVKEQRDGVGIDRLTGGAYHSAKFDLEVVSSDVSFETDIHLRNFEIWQIGMLFAVIQDMKDGLLRIGSGRARGLGSVTAEISTSGKHGRPGGMVFTTMRGTEEQEPDDQLWGLGRWLNDGSYGTQKSESDIGDVLKLSKLGSRSMQGIRNLRAFTSDSLDALRDAAIEQFLMRMQQWSELSGVPTAPGGNR